MKKKLPKIKNTIGIFPQLVLCYKGKRDYRHHVIRKDKSGQYMSPFVKKEISLYKMAVQREKEYFMEFNTKTQVNVNRAQLELERKETESKLIGSSNEGRADDFTTCKKCMTTIDAQRKELQLLNEKEEDVFSIRCNQLRHLLEARIAVYWRGVLLRSNSEDDNLPPSLNIEQYLNEASS